MKTNDLFLNVIYERLSALDEALHESDNDCSIDDVIDNTRNIIHHFKKSNIALSDGILYSAENNREFKEELIKNLYDCLNLCCNHSYTSEIFNQKVNIDYKSDGFIYVHFENKE